MDTDPDQPVPDLIAAAVSRPPMETDAVSLEHTDAVAQLVALTIEMKAFARDAMVEKIPAERWEEMAQKFQRARRLCLSQVPIVGPEDVQQ